MRLDSCVAILESAGISAHRAREAVERQWSRYQDHLAQETAPGDWEQFEAACDAIAAQDVLVRHNFTCCRTCADEEIGDERSRERSAGHTASVGGVADAGAALESSSRLRTVAHVIGSLDRDRSRRLRGGASAPTAWSLSAARVPQDMLCGCCARSFGDAALPARGAISAHSLRVAGYVVSSW
ncbi:DUF6891 domain-containing protein [Mycobacteroides franklinii]|uniref:DUF6891 domain-containing protein n=1 Tax=Mycobacteroides franklinii TaxID=948102 RepID=UPI0038B31BFC